MSAKYHINPQTGDVNRCRAIIRCKFTTEDNHFPTIEAAQKAYEETKSGMLFKTFTQEDDSSFTSQEVSELEKLFLKTTLEKLDTDGT